MSAEAVLNDLLAKGIRPSVTPDKTGIVVPRGSLTPDLKAAILANKPELIRLISVAAPRSPASLPAATPAPTTADTRKVGEVIQKATRHVLRVERFVWLGLPTGEAEALAERLALRDRDFDNRTACAECANLTGRPGAWRCTNYRTAGVGAPSLPGVFVAQMLQHCRGFKEGIK